MISKNLLSRLSNEEFTRQCAYFGIAVSNGSISKPLDHTDLERFFLAATYNFDNSRLCEGSLCWLKKFALLLSPSKVRRLIAKNIPFDKAVLGGFLSFIIENKLNHRQWMILKSYTKKKKVLTSMYSGPQPKNPNPHFLKFNILVHDFQLDQNKFLLPIEAIYKNCIEIKNRALFGSIVNADIASYLTHYPNANAYEISKETANHKARVFKIHNTVRTAMMATAS